MRDDAGTSVSCRACNAAIVPVVDLGRQPVGGRFPLPGDPPEARAPLRLGVCGACGLAQLADPSPPEADESDAPSPLSSATMSDHVRGFVDELAGRGLLAPSARILTIASHGAHVGPFLRERGIQATALEGSPARAASLAAAGESVLAAGLDGPEAVPTAGTGGYDLVVDMYLLAHLERPRTALRRLASLLAPEGTAVLEFDHLQATVEGGQWDAIRHGHQSYLSLGWVARELADVGLVVTDALSQPVYGGALRVYARAGGSAGPAVGNLAGAEAAAGIDRPIGLGVLREAVERCRAEVATHLRSARDAGRRVVGYGAPARAVTFLNGLGIGPDLLPFVVDRSPAKQGRTIPGVGIPILPLDALTSQPPDELLILTWDLAREVRRTLGAALPGTRFMVAVPRLAEVGADEAGRAGHAA